jgi:hypothetical protein
MTNRIKTGGRKLGTPNILTNELRHNIATLLNNNFDKMQTDLNALQPSNRLNILIELYKLCLPKINEVNDTENINFNPIQVHIIKPNGANNK